MEVICAYCDSYVEIEDKDICPHCGASLAEAIRQVKKEQREEEQRAREAEQQQKKGRKRGRRNRSHVGYCSWSS